MRSPTFILLNPQMGENIGAVARAMSNFGLSDLRIVAPRDGWPNEAAIAMAAHGTHILENAMVVETLAEALHDIHALYATTPREDVLGKEVFMPREVMERVIASTRSSSSTYRGEELECEETTSEPFTEAKKIAFLFGPERNGLSNEDIVLADAIVSIPVSTENPSLNLAQAAVVIAYEWHIRDRGSEVGGQKLDAVVPATGAGISTKAELEGLFEHARELLDKVNYFRNPIKARLMWQHMRVMWVRAELSEQEIRTLRGLIRAILRKL